MATATPRRRTAKIKRQVQNESSSENLASRRTLSGNVDFILCTSQKAGDCSVVQNGTGNTASLKCYDIDATLAKQVQEILNGTKQNASAAKAMSEKLDRILKHMDQEDAQPLVGLKIVGAKGPGLACVNESAVIARDILWEVVIWNRDTLELQPLPIPTQNAIAAGPVTKAALTTSLTGLLN